jgi:hypothetical protein
MAPGHDAAPSGRHRNLLSGVICTAAGAGALLEAKRYGIGSLDQLGPGFYPAVLGGLLAVVGLLITLTRSPEEAETDPILDAGGDLRGPDWRGWFCIIAAVALFIMFAWLGGLAPAIFACVFIAALGDRTASLKGSLLVALVMTICGTVLFGYFLGINMPLWQWPFSR